MLASVVSCNFNQPAGNSFMQVIQNGNAGDAASLMEIPALDGDEVILKHKGYVTSYDADAMIPEWVAYELTAEETRGDASREESIFKMDPQYRKAQAMREDYYDSGWTKGHMACAGDFKWDADALDGTFYLTNICPQDETLNGGDWNYLEKQVRYWARDNGRAWVVTGPIIGMNKYGRIGDNDVVVPDSFFKAVLIPRGEGYSAIAFVMGNDSRRYYLEKCALSVNELERMTGMDFFPNLPDDVEEKVEGKVTLSDFNIKVR